MAKIFEDRMENMSLTEKQGVITSLSRRVRVVWDEDEREQSYRILQKTLELLSANGYSLFSTLFDEFNPDDKLNGEINNYGALVLVERHPQIGQSDPCVVDVDLKYEHIVEGPNQDLSKPMQGVIFGKGRCSIAEKSTNFYRPYGDTAFDKIQIMVGHKFEDDDKSVAGAALVNQQKFPHVITQGGEINIPFPQGNFQCEGIIDLVNISPFEFGMQIVRHVNKLEWQGQPKYTWLCSEASWQVLNPRIGRYRFGFEFQFNEDSWYPTVVFLDQRTGRPPAKVVKASFTEPSLVGTQYDDILSQQSHPNFDAANADGHFPAGMWDVPALPVKDFNEFFRANFEQPPGPPFPAQIG